MVLAAFAETPILTLGSTDRIIDFERVWRRALRKRAPRATGWSETLTVECFVVNVRAAAAPDKDGLLQPLLRRWQAGGVGLATFGLPAIQAVVDFKWHKFARRFMLIELAIFLVWLAAFNYFTMLFQDEDTTMTLRELAATPLGALTLAAEAVAMLAMLPFLVLEAGTLAAYGHGCV